MFFEMCYRPLETGMERIKVLTTLWLPTIEIPEASAMYMYVSPEMLTTTTRAQYNQKVDLYSLGVMFFEMCYRPLETGMERIKVLTTLRLPTIELPEDFDEVQCSNQVMNHQWSRQPFMCLSASFVTHIVLNFSQEK